MPAEMLAVIVGHIPSTKWKLIKSLNTQQMKKINWKEIFKFLSGSFFVTAGASWYFAWYKVDLPFLGTVMTHQFLFIRGFIHFALFLTTFYFGFIRKTIKR